MTRELVSMASEDLVKVIVDNGPNKGKFDLILEMPVKPFLKHFIQNKGPNRYFGKCSIITRTVTRHTSVWTQLRSNQQIALNVLLAPVLLLLETFGLVNCRVLNHQARTRRVATQKQWNFFVVFGLVALLT